MTVRIINGLAELTQSAGQEMGVSEWVPITQEMIDRFAELTGDRQWIHIDVERARRESPFGAPIAHGFLTVSMLSRLLHEVVEVRGTFGRECRSTPRGTFRAEWRSPGAWSLRSRTGISRQ